MRKRTIAAAVVAALMIAAPTPHAGSAEGEAPQDGSSASPAHTAQHETFADPGASPWVVPCGVSEVAVGAWGAEGGDGNDFGFGFENDGGLGGHSEDTIAVTPGETLTVAVGGAGGDAVANTGGDGGTGGGGDGADNPGGSGFAGGGGGGASLVRRDTTTLIGAGDGGGGGGGWAGDGGTFGDHEGGDGGGTGTDGAGVLDTGGKAGSTGGAGGSTAGPPGAPGEAANGPDGGHGGTGTEGVGGGGGGGGGATTGGGGGGTRPFVNGGGGGGGDGYVQDGTTTNGISANNDRDGKITLTYPIEECPTAVTGTVVDSVSGQPVPGAWVAMLNTSDFSIAGSAVADGAGDYSAEVPAGSYYAYVIDPTGDHVAGFHGPPTTVVVPASTLVDLDPAAVPTRGSITGTATEEGTGAPVGGVWAITLSGSTGSSETGVMADGAGDYEVPRVTPGEHFVAVVDPTGAHRPEFWPDSPDVPGATKVTVGAGSATVTDLALATQTPVAGGSTVSGTVTESGTGHPLAGVHVVALRAADFRFARGAVTDGSGEFDLDVVAGGYKLAFVDPTGLHDAEWHDDKPSFDLAQADLVTAPTLADAALDPRTGAMAGTVTDGTSGTPLAGVWVVAIGPSGIAGGTVTATDGTYAIDRLPAGSYRLTFADPVGGRTQEFWDGATDFSGATVIPITAGATATADAALEVP